MRLDLATGRVAGGPRPPSASALTVIGERIAVLVPAGGHYELRFAAGAGVKLSAGVELGWKGRPPQLMDSPRPLVRGGIWLASAHGAKLFSVTTGRVLAALGFRAEVSDLSESPAGEFVYVALDELSQHPLAKVSNMVDELDATTGRLLAHHGIDFGVGPAVLTPVPGGVWVAYRTGMAGSAVLFRSQGLEQAPYPVPVRPFAPVPQYGSGQIMGYWAAYLGGDLWLQSYGGVSCVVPGTGAQLAGVAFSAKSAVPEYWDLFAAWGSLVYGDTSQGIIAIRSAAACHLRPAGQVLRALGTQGVGTVRFGTTKAKAVAGLSELLGRPTWQGVNSGCGPRYTEVEWGQLVAEFRLGAFSGYLYMRGGWPLTTPGSPRQAPPSGRAGLDLATTKGNSLGSTLGQVRLAYGKLHFVGVDKWRAANGIIFVVDALRDLSPRPARSSRSSWGPAATSENCPSRPAATFKERTHIAVLCVVQGTCSPIRETYIATDLATQDGSATSAEHAPSSESRRTCSFSERVIRRCRGSRWRAMSAPGRHRRQCRC